MVLHVIPLPSFVDGRFADIVSEIAKGKHVPLPLDEVGFSNQASVNLDGYLNKSVKSEPRSRVAYAQFFRNRAIEGVGELRSGRQYRIAFYQQRSYKSGRVEGQAIPRRD